MNNWLQQLQSLLGQSTSPNPHSMQPVMALKGSLNFWCRGRWVG